MFGIKPEIKVTMFPRKDRTNEVPTDEPKIDYIGIAEEAASRLGKKLVVGAIVVSVTAIAAATLGSIAVTAVEHALEK